MVFRKIVTSIRFLKDETGSALVEATIITPIVMLVTIISLLMLVYFTTLTFNEITANEYLLHRIGADSNTRIIRYDKRIFDKDIKNDMDKKIYSVSLDDEIKFGLLSRKQSNINVSKYSLRERKLIWYKDLFDEIVGK